MSWSKTDEPFELPRKIRDQIKHVTFGGSPGKERALITTLDTKLHISSANFLSNDQGRNVTSLPDNITHAALNWNNTLAQVRRTSGGRGNMPVRRHQVHSRVQRGRAEQVRLVVTSIENGLFTSTPTTCKLPSEGDIVLIQWISVDELVIVVKQNSEYQIFFWCTTLKHEYTLITRALVGEEETIFSDFIISPDGKYYLLVSNNGMLLFSSDTEDDNPTLPSVLRKIDAEAASFMNSGGPSSVLVTATFERPVITVTARELLSPNSDSTIRVLGRAFEHEIVPLNLDEVGVRFLHFLQDGTGFLLTENTLYVVNIDPSLMNLTPLFKEFTYYDIGGAVHIRSDSSSPNTHTLYALAFKPTVKKALLCTLPVHYDTTPSESSVTGNHSTLSNENETLSTSSNNVGFEPTGELVRVASPSGSTANKGSTANNGPPLEPPAKTPEKLEAEKLKSPEDEDNVSDTRTPPQNNSDRGVDDSTSTRLGVTQRSRREFTTTVSLGMDPPIDQSDGSGNTQQAEKEEDLLANEDIGINTAKSLHSSSLNHEVGTEISTTDALAVDSGEQETPLRSPTSSSDAPAPDSSNSEGQTTNANAKAIVNPFEVEEDDDATKSSRSTSPAGSPRASTVSAKSIGAPKSAADDGLKNSQLSTPKRSGSPSNPLPFQTKSSSFELDDASVSSDGSKAIELTTNDHRFEDAAKAVGVSPQDGSAINGAILHHPRKDALFYDVEEAPVHPPQDNLNATNSEQQPLGDFGSSSSSLSHYDADEEENEDDDNEEEDVDQDSAEESSISDHNQDVELGREKDGNALSEDEQVVATTPQRPGKGLVFTGTNSDSDKTVLWNSADAARQQLNLQSSKGEDDESSEDDEDLDEDIAQKSSGENGRVLNVASPPPAKMEVISISSGSPSSEDEDADETGGVSDRNDLNNQGNVPRGVQHDAISVYSSYDYDVSSSTGPTEQQILDFVDSRFEIADLDKMTRKDFQRQAVKHFFGLEDRNVLGDDRKQMIKVRVNELLARTSTQRESLEDEDDELLIQNEEDEGEDDAEFELEGSEEESDDATERMEHLLRDHNDEVENEVAGSALENQRNVPRGVQNDIDAISVYSSSSSSGSVQSNESESEGDENAEADGNNRGGTGTLIFSGTWDEDRRWWHQTRRYHSTTSMITSNRHFFTSPGRFRFNTKIGAQRFRSILLGEANGNEVTAYDIFRERSLKGFCGRVSEEFDRNQRLLHIP